MAVLAGCSPFEEPYLSFESRETVEILDQELVEVFTYKKNYNSDTFYVNMNRLNRPQVQLLTLVDTQVLGKFIMENGRSYDNNAYSGEIGRYLGNFQHGKRLLKILVSGKIKASNPRDSLPGEPFLLEKITQTPPCPLEISPRQLGYPLQNIIWKWVGFIDDSNQIYSHPTCENPLSSLQFSTDTASYLKAYFNPQIPDALYVNFTSGIIPFYKFYRYVYKMENQYVNFFHTIYYGPTRHPTLVGFTTKRAVDKYDSLRSLINPDSLFNPAKVEFEINNNTLILSRKNPKIRALFIAD